MAHIVHFAGGRHYYKTKQGTRVTVKGYSYKADSWWAERTYNQWDETRDRIPYKQELVDYGLDYNIRNTYWVDGGANIRNIDTTFYTGYYR